jgi:hypothetical protein
MTIAEATELMRNAVGSPDECRMMNELADVWEDADGMVVCGECDGDGVYFDTFPRQVDCEKCLGGGYVSNGNSLRAEALRLLAECGKVGHRAFGYGIATKATDCDLQARVCLDWFYAADRGPMANGDVMVCRLLLIDAYAAVDTETRERWARETRALVPTEDPA